MGGDKQARGLFCTFLNIDSYFKDQTDEGTEKWSEFWFLDSTGVTSMVELMIL